MSSFIEREYSLRGSQPIECYHIYNPLFTEQYFLTTHNQPINIAGIGVFHPANLKRGVFARSEQPLSGNIRIEIDSGHEFVTNNRFRFGKPLLYIKAYRVQLEVSGYSRFFEGTVVSIEIESNTAVIEATDLSNKKNSPLQRFRAFANCAHGLYGVDCGLNQLNFTYVGTIEGFGDTMSVIKSSIFVGKQTRLGSIFAPASGEKRVITKSLSPDEVQVIRPFDSVNSIGSPISFSLGCDKRIITCRNRFNNAKRFGGFPEMPIDDPYKTTKLRRYR